MLAAAGLAQSVERLTAERQKVITHLVMKGHDRFSIYITYPFWALKASL